MTALEIEPRWIGSSAQRRFGVLVRPRSGIRGALVFVPPFGEEMNKSRRMVAAASRALAADGWAVLSVDLFGCGDSPGHLEAASWPTWRDDVVRAHAWLSEHAGIRAGLWALRAGALLADAAASSIDALPTLLLWQPVVAGKAHLTQFLRLKVAAGALGGTHAAVSTSDLLAQLKRGESLDIAGYRLPPAVALPMADAEVGTPAQATRVTWLEVTAEGNVSPAGERKIAAWRASGVTVRAQAVSGPPFWQTTELEDCPSLIDATRHATSASDG